MDTVGDEDTLGTTAYIVIAWIQCKQLKTLETKVYIVNNWIHCKQRNTV